MIIDEKLNWEEQFRCTKGKISGGREALKRLKNVIPQSQLCKVYYALIESHLRYANVIWGSLAKPKIAALQRFQYGAFSIVTNAGIEGSWSTSWLNVENLFHYDHNAMTSGGAWEIW